MPRALYRFFDIFLKAYPPHWQSETEMVIAVKVPHTVPTEMPEKVLLVFPAM